MYATIEDMLKRFGEAEINAIAGAEKGAIDEDKVKTALNDAEELINAYVGAKHSLPLSVVPQSLKRICCNLARYFLYVEVKPEELEKTYEKDIAFLKDIARGVVVLEHSETGTMPKQSDDVVYTGTSARLFSHKQMKGF